MAKLERKQQKIFAVNSSDTAGDGTSIYGTPSSGTVQYSKDVEEIQNSNKWELGQASALIGAGIPAMEDHNSLFYVATRQLKYIYQEGIPEYLATETYYKGSICKTITIDGDKVASQLWFSKIDNNINHSPTEDTENEYWVEFKGSGGGGGSYSGGLFDIITKDHEVIDDNLKLLGSTINKTNYEKFYNICKEEYEVITNQKLYTFHYIDYADRGYPSNISNYGYKGLSMLGNTKCTFSNSAYFQFMDNLDIPANTTWEFNCKLKYTAEYTGEQCLCSFGSSKYSVLLQIYSTRKLRINLSSNGSSWNIANNITSTNQMSINTDYYIKLIYNGANYRVLVSETGEFTGEEVEYIKVEISTPIYNNTADASCQVYNQRINSMFGSSPNVEFDMKYYNIKVGDNFVYTNEDWYLVKNSNGHIYYDTTTEKKRTFRYLEADNRGTASNISNYGYKDIWKAGDMKVTFVNSAGFTFLNDFNVSNGETWEVNMKLKYLADYTGSQTIFNSDLTSSTFRLNNKKIQCYLSSNNSSWNIANGNISTNALQVGIDYYIRILFDGSAYKVLVSETGQFEGEEVEYLNIASNLSIGYSNGLVDNVRPNGVIGSSPLIEFDMLYYNIKVGDNFVYTNQDVWVDFGRDKAMVDEEYNENGVAWYYGINTTNETVKLPRNKYMKNLYDGKVRGDGVNSLGMTNGSSEFYLGTWKASTAVSGTTAMNNGNARPLGSACSTYAPSGGVSITANPNKSGVILNKIGELHVYMVVNDNNE